MLLLAGPVVWVGRVLVGFGCGALLGWMALAVYFDFSLLGPPWLRAGFGVLLLVSALVALWLVRPRWWALAGILGAFVVVLAAWLAIPPSNARDWQPDVATLLLDELAYDIGAIDRSLPFTVLRGRSHINERAKAANDDPRFSVRIRDGLPRMSLDRRSEGVTP